MENRAFAIRPANPTVHRHPEVRSPLFTSSATTDVGRRLECVRCILKHVRCISAGKRRIDHVYSAGTLHLTRNAPHLTFESTPEEARAAPVARSSGFSPWPWSLARPSAERAGLCARWPDMYIEWSLTGAHRELVHREAVLSPSALGRCKCGETAVSNRLERREVSDSERQDVASTLEPH